MTKLSIPLALICLSILGLSRDARAWFLFIPFGAIQRGLETDPDSIVLSASDRLLGKCGGYHVNQAQKFSTADSAFPTDAAAPPAAQLPESAESRFHRKMAEMAVSKSTDKELTAKSARAYGTRWGRVAAADMSANRAYGADLVRGCIQNDIPFRLIDYPSWQTRQQEQHDQKSAPDQAARREAEEMEKRTEETQKRVLTEDEKKRMLEVTNVTPPLQTVSTGGVDYMAEARKSARILGCVTQDVRVVGVEGQNILFAASCEMGQSLGLTCDQSGLCLK